MDQVPNHVSFLFAIAVVFTLIALYYAAQKSAMVLIVASALVIIQSAIAVTGFYLQTDVLPPRFMLLPGPPLLLVLLMFTTRKGRSMLDKFDLKWLTWLHVVRIPVEIVLFWLFIDGLVPEVMTFGGRNFDVLSGLSAAIVYFFAFKRDTVNRKLLLAWNLVCLMLLLNIVITAVLSAPGPQQQMAFEQPNVGVLYFPFALLPGFVVPAVLLAHLAALRQLFNKEP